MGREHHVLLVEDNDIDAAVFTRYVETLPGYRVVRVGSLEEAEEQVERTGAAHWDLIAVDLTLPDAVDLEAVAFARERLPHAVCVAVTARNPDEVDERALRAGAADLLVKGQMNARGVQRAVSHAVERNELVRRQLESERNLRSVLGAWSDALFVVDGGRRVLFSNDAAAAFAEGVTEPVDGGRRLRVEIQPGDVLQAEVRGGAAETVPVEVRAWRITWADQPAMVVVLRDRRAERAVAKARALAELGRGALKGVHDIGNRVSTLQGALAEAHDLLATDPEALRERLPDWLATLERSVNHIADVVRSSRQHATEVRQRRIPVELAALVRSCCQDLRTTIEATAGLRLQLEPATVVMGDPTDLTRVVDNLLRNAIEAIGPGNPADHEIRAQVRSEGDRVLLEIEDTGPGIPPELLGHVFDEGVTGKHDGTGLGLASVRRAIRAHGGTVAAHNTPGRGACFVVDLPARQGRVAGVRILLLEDQPEVARANARLLGERYEVVPARDGQAALDILDEDTAFTVVLCDLDMPQMDGRTFYDTLRTRHPALLARTVFCSGGAATPEMEAFLRATGRPVLGKPLDLGTAIAMIEATAARSHDDAG